MTTAAPPPSALRAIPPSLTPPAAARAGHTVQGDLLGVVRIPAAEARRAMRAGLDGALLDTFFPAANDPQRGGERVRLSRGPAYYRPRTTLPWAAALGAALARLDDNATGQTPALRHALLDNLHNLTAAATYALWHDLTDHPGMPGDARPAALERLLHVATTTAAARHGLTANGPLVPAPGDLTLLQTLKTGWRTFRELDNPAKITDELRFLAAHVLARRPDITALLAPLYGSLSLALAARTLLPALLGRPIDVHLVRLGFHDQAKVAYLGTDGTVRHPATAPRPHRERLAAAARGGATLLVIDDNVGYGSTMRAARTLIEQLGGRAVTRSVESAWSLYHRSGRHDIADAADLPSLRPNLHHSIQERLTGHLLRGDAHTYLRDAAHHVPGTLPQQMAASFDLAVSTGTWNSGQLAAMRAELGHATAFWNEPPVPRPYAPTA